MLLTPVQYAVVDFLNTVFGDTKEAKKYWKEVSSDALYSVKILSLMFAVAGTGGSDSAGIPGKSS